jgi:hypothetical protein
MSSYKTIAEPVLAQITALSKLCVNLHQNHGSLIDYLAEMIMAFTKKRNELNDDEKIKLFEDVLKKWHFLYCLFYDQFMWSFNGRCVGEKRTLFSDVEGLVDEDIVCFDIINSSMKILEEINIKKEDTLLQSELENKFNILENQKTNIFDQLKKIKDSGSKKLKSCKDMYLRSLKLSMEAPKHLEASAVSVILKFDEQCLLRLEQGMYTEHFTENKNENFFADFVSFLTTRRQESGMHF